ncbi:MAG: hypothetical protein ACREBA_02240 [Nitrosotalea sp.]
MVRVSTDSDPKVSPLISLIIVFTADISCFNSIAVCLAVLSIITNPVPIKDKISNNILVHTSEVC